MDRGRFIQTQAGLGQSQAARSTPKLRGDAVPIDLNTPAELARQVRELSARVSFYADDPTTAAGTWQTQFAGATASLAEANDGATAAHLGLLGAFFELYQRPRALLNDFTARHRDFQYRDVLRFEARPALADRAAMILELKRGAAPLLVTPEQSFTAKDAQGAELSYRPVREVVVGQGRVTSLCSVYRDASGVRFAPLANSADGLGAPPAPAAPTGAAAGAVAPEPSWPPFGNAELPAAPIGFALASQVLRLREGKRTIRLELELAGLDAEKHRSENWGASLRAFLTGPQGWLGPYLVTGELRTSSVKLSLTIPATDAAVVDFDASLHAQTFSATTPIVQLVLQPDAPLRHADVAALALGVVQIHVDVEGMRSLQLENDHGALNPKKAFQPFGPQPVVGSRFLVASDEALSKRLTDLKLKLAWQGAPPDLGKWYEDYRERNEIAKGVSVRLIYQDRSGQPTSALQDLMLRTDGVTTLSPSAPPPSPQWPRGSGSLVDRAYEMGILGLARSGSAFGRALARRGRLQRPMFDRPSPPPPTVRSGFVSLMLETDFLHSAYIQESVALALKPEHKVLRPPYTPLVREIELSYSASSEPVDVSASSDAAEVDFATAEVQFFHVGCFGTAREHGFLRARIPYSHDKVVRLLPAYPDEGELLIGLSGVGPGDAVSLWVQVAPGSGDADRVPPEVRWSVLGDNAWRALGPRELAVDTTRRLTSSGVVALALPPETSLDHTLMPSGKVWLKAAVAADSAASCRLIDVLANAVEVEFAGGDSPHLARPLPAGSIGKLKAAPPAVKQATQPFASQGGRSPESPEQLAVRAAERCRHRQRCVTAWDYERLLLEAFPAVHRLMCIPHASDVSWLAPGHVLLVALADVHNQNGVDVLAPRVDRGTLLAMAELAQRHTGSQVRVHVRNPRYRRVLLDFKVGFRPGLPFAYYRAELERALIGVLCPWAYGSSQQVELGSRWYRSVLLSFVEDLKYVDFVTDFRMGLEPEAGQPFVDVAELAPDEPDVVLVSAAAHRIAPSTT